LSARKKQGRTFFAREDKRGHQDEAKVEGGDRKKGKRNMLRKGWRGLEGARGKSRSTMS